MDLKRAFDIAAAASLAVLTAPILAGAALVTACSLRENPIYSQCRVGLDGQEFKIYKLKSMRELFGVHGIALPDHQRITEIGKILRASKLDELPQLYNVLAGDMSMVGPRPLQPCWKRAHDKTRQQAKPGLTGPTQIFGRLELDEEQITQIENEYILNQSFMSDMKYLIKTPFSILKHCASPTIGNTKHRL